MSDWLPIETAPKNAIIQLLHGGEVYCGWFTGNRYYPWSFIDSTKTETFEEGGNREFVEPNGWPPNNGPSHWKHLSGPPK